MSDIIVGFGEIGKAVFSVLNNGTRAGKVYIKDLQTKDATPVGGTDVMHVCFPYSEAFVMAVKDYIRAYKPEHVVIWSTLPIGTTKQIPGAVHSPVEGVHPHLASSIKQMVRWIGANNKGEGEFFVSYFKELLLATKVVDSSDFTEALKLLSTTEYGVNIEFARYKKQVAAAIGMDFELTKEWNKTYNKLYHNLDMEWARKYILDAPHGKKGGHCITPNARLLQEQYPDELVRIVAEL